MIETAKGVIRAKLFAAECPNTVNNFVFLASQGFYDNTVIHRSVPGFIVQMGDPTGTGTGGPGYTVIDELRVARHRGYDRGTVAMANAGPNTNGSQFFICLEDVELPPSYSVFGEVTSGMEVVDTIARQPRNGEFPVPEIRVRSVSVGPV